MIIVNWNSWDMLSRCLDKLKKQTFQDFNVVVVDNASEQPMPKGFLVQYSNITLIQNKTNKGFAAGNNQAIHPMVNSKFIGLLNPDAFPERDWLKQLVDAANLMPDMVAFSSRQILYDSSNILDGIGDVYHISGLVWRARHGKYQQRTDLVQREIFSPCAAAALYRRQAVVDVGGFDEDFFCYVEDVDLGFRLRLAGYKAMYVPDAVVHHIGSATTGGQQSDFSVYHGHRNLVWTYIKNMPGVLFWILLPYHILLNIFTIGWFVLRGQGRVILRAKWDAMKGIPHMWRKRKVIQSNRTASVKDIWRVMNKRLIP